MNPIIIDIVLILILAIFVIVNMVRGFFKQIFKLAVGIGAILIAYFFCDNLANLLNEKWGVLTKLSSTIMGWFGNGAEYLETATSESIRTAVSANGLPEFIAEMASESLAGAAGGAVLSVGALISEAFAKTILIVLCFIALHIVSKLLLSIVAFILNKVVELPVVSSINRILGLVLGLIKGILVVSVLICVINVIPSGFFMTLNDAISQSLIGGFMQSHNIFTILVSWIASKF